MARNVAKAGAAKMEAAGNRRGCQQAWPGHSQCRTPAVIPGAAPDMLFLIYHIMSQFVFVLYFSFLIL
jgi:hypothetical protein